MHEAATSNSSSSKLPPPKRASIGKPAAALLAGGGLFSFLYAISNPDSEDDHHKAQAEDKAASPPAAADERDPSLPRFRLTDVRKHNASSGSPWVTHDDKVYDITDWVAAHPGGDVILRAAGGSIDPYWNIFTIHKAAHVYEILAQYLIGYIDAADLVDGRPPRDAVEDPFESDPVRDARMTVHTAKPCNAEPPNDQLEAEFLTPNELFYVRNHMWVPVVDDQSVDKHTLTVELPDGEERTYTMGELRRKFQTHRITAALQCSGNRRNDMTRHAHKTNGLQWGVGAISNAEWEGVRLMDVLKDAGLKVADLHDLTAVRPQSDDEGASLPDPNTHHVQFSGLEAYGASIPLATALDPRNDVLLAFSMNGKPLPRDHGFPLRAVVPGHVAARSVKWLSKIVVSDEESSTQWQRRDYKGFGPNEGPKPDWDRAAAIQELPVTSAVTGVWVGESVRDGGIPCSQSSQNDISEESPPIALQGYAMSGGGREIRRVDVSLDGGKTWDQAELLDDCPPSAPCKGNKAWAWKRWRYTSSLPQITAPTDSQKRQCTTIVVKATDDSYNTQPDTHAGVYNVRGNLANAWHRVRVCPSCTVTEAGDKKVIWRTGKTFGCGFQQEKEDEKLEEGPSP
ncbi:putative sulfite oxidase protein [Phaeoacremonium minimum UCRPA7]|uniref:Nitrate reductase [NADPH] n=1 Tax=Phaeoacremonium minimum (strain UCR-PA7) TaxID=1286976 RepID=R8BSP8_PHAM7|nr:putative sulfite oxidase protein [Phaeoacremonium minimum UCRPA7]EOO02397.1 putative sulfite oxidase protein [Phaeoacremonium minimum UCRPA7]